MRPAGRDPARAARRVAPAAAGFLAVVLAAVFLPVLTRDATLIPYAPGAYHDGPYGYPGPAPAQSVLDPWGSVWIEKPEKN